MASEDFLILLSVVFKKPLFEVMYFFTSYITENQQITLHLKTVNSCRQQEEQKYKSLFHHYIVSLNYAIAKAQKLLQ